jgi:hypothetical protein
MLERIAFLVERMPWYRVFGCVIEEALSEGIDVYLFLCDTPESRTGPKGYDWADPLRVPAFRSGFPEIHQWKSPGEVEALCRELRVQVVFSIWLYPPFYPLREALMKQGIRWIALQHATEHLVLPKESLLLPDAVCLSTDYWINHAVQFFRDADPDELRKRLIATGFPELDALQGIRPEEIHRKYSIPENAPVVVWLPHDVHPYDLWESLVFRLGWQLRPWLNVFLQGRWSILKRRAVDPTLTQLFRSVRDFCDRNGAFLVTKSRVKDRPSAIEKSLPDLFTFDRDPHPTTILELLSVASLCIHFFSHVALEAAASGIPSLCLVPPDHSDFMSGPNTGWRRAAGDLRAEGTVWNYPGVNYQWPLEKAVSEFEKAKLGDFAMKKKELQTYLDRFVGPVDGRSSERVLHLARRLIN